MATKIRRRTGVKQTVRAKHKKRIRSRLWGTPERPRLCVYRSNRNIIAQLVDDTKGATLVSASTQEEELKGKAGVTLEGAKQVGGLIAKRAQAKNLSTIVFDRSGYVYHGRIKAVADAAREGGLKF